MWDRLLQWDRDTLVYLNALGAGELDTFWAIVTNITTWIPLYLLFGFLMFFKRANKEGWIKLCVVMAATIFVLGLTKLVKNQVTRIRPNNDIDIGPVINVLKTPTDYSFFSGHAASSFTITVLVYLLLRRKYRWAHIFFLWPLLFASSRIFVGVHFPLDILVGALVGVSCALLFYTIFKKYIAPKWLANPA